MSISWKGVFPAFTTKFTANDTLDLALFEKGLQSQLDAGVDGIVLGGSLGEASTLTTDEKETLVKLAIEIAGPVPVVLNIAEGNGRYFDADRHKFIDQAEAAGTKSGAYVDLCWWSGELNQDQRSQGIQLLASVVRILNALGAS